jgi:hypothetical protein
MIALHAPMAVLSGMPRVIHRVSAPANAVHTKIVLPPNANFWETTGNFSG